MRAASYQNFCRELKIWFLPDCPPTPPFSAPSPAPLAGSGGVGGVPSPGKRNAASLQLWKRCTQGCKLNSSFSPLMLMNGWTGFNRVFQGTHPPQDVPPFLAHGVSTALVTGTPLSQVLTLSRTALAHLCTLLVILSA